MIFALKQNIEIKNHKKEKTLLAFQIYEHNCKKSVFYLLREMTSNKIIERKMKDKSKELYSNKLLHKYWQQWLVYKLNSATNRLNQNLADHFRE